MDWNYKFADAVASKSKTAILEQRLNIFVQTVNSFALSGVNS